MQVNFSTVTEAFSKHDIHSILEEDKNTIKKHKNKALISDRSLFGMQQVYWLSQKAWLVSQNDREGC